MCIHIKSQPVGDSNDTLAEQSPRAGTILRESLQLVDVGWAQMPPRGGGYTTTYYTAPVSYG
ncbi:hypothetical protein ABIG06_003165 [Bradyrhizobium sp. USDA 326]